jgi:two-component system, cell cycle sensor histidine kinase and response regulator CckA
MRRRVLVVEDNPITRKMLRFALETEGYQALEAGDGRSALELAAIRLPDLLVQDYVLPDMDGLELLESFRRLPGAAELPVLVVTGMVSGLEELRARSDPFTILLPKPLEPSRLIEIVGTQLTGRSARLGEGRRVLVVDDEPLGRKLAAMRLKDAGFETEVAESAEEALRMARIRPPDAILSDVLMPGMDGFLFSKAVRSEPRLALTPLVLLSASYVEDADRRLAREVGANALLLRTPDLKEAIATLGEALQAGGAAPVPTASDAWEELHQERVQVQLERQLARNDALLRQGAIQAAALSVVRGLTAALAEPRELPNMLGDILVHCLDAAGLSTGLLYLVGASGDLRLQAQAGLASGTRSQAAHSFGEPETLWHILKSGEPAALGMRRTGSPEDVSRLSRFAATLGKASVLVIPFVVGQERLGLLVLASDAEDLGDPAWLSFARALAVQFGQAIALSRSLSRGAASEVRYRTLMEHAGDAIVALDREFKVLEVNSQAEALLGRPRAEIVGRRYSEFVPADEQDESERGRQRLLREGTLRIEDRGLLRADGVRVPVDISASLVQLGEEVVAFAIVRDISERKRAETELRDAQRREHDLVSASPAILYSLRVVGDKLPCTWVGENVARVIGHSVERALTPGWWVENLHPDDRDWVLGEVAPLLAKGNIVREYRFRHGDGRYRWIRDEQRLLRDAAGQPLEVVGSWSDVTVRKQAELKLQESEEQYRLLFEGNPQPMWVYDHESFRFLAVNDAAVRQYGWSRDEFLGMTIKDIRPNEDVARLLETLEKPVSRPAHSETWKHRTKGGALLDVEIAANPLSFHGKSARLVLANNVTERRTLEAQLVQAQKMEAIGRLAGGVAHDFNNMLGVIMGFSELLLKDLGAQHRGRKRVEQIRKAADRAAGLTRQLLAFSRKQVLQPKVLDLNVVVTEIEKMLRRLIGEDIRLVVVLGEPPAHVRADPGQIEQVIINLAVNARDAMPKGGRLIIETSNVDLDDAYVRTHTYVQPGPYTMLAVSDTGDGMDAATLSHLFEPFFTTKEAGKGTGLGLATVFGIVKQSGGHITVYSEPGKGSTFKVYLPRVDEKGDAVVPAAAEPVPTGHETVLLLEDEEAIRLLIREILETAGYTVLDAGRPEDAADLAASREGRIHLLLTDVILPGMSGAELARRVQETRPETKVLFMSGYTDEAIGHHGVLESGTHFLQKPFASDALLRKVRDVLDAPAL